MFWLICKIKIPTTISIKMSIVNTNDILVEPDSVFLLWTVSEIFRSEERNVTRDEEQIEFG